LITIVDYGAGNLASIGNMLRRLGVDSRVTASPTDVLSASKLILPGVGHFDHGMKNLRERGLDDALTQRVVRDGIPILGICLGLQLFARGSEEGTLPGLGWIDADVRRFDVQRIGANLRIPHMGWANTTVEKPDPLTADLPPDSRFYFVHSFHVVADHDEDVWMRATHGYPFVAAIARGTIRGVQFHPEKSHKFGLRLLASFAGNV
jgi:glutamine amidotransferase